MISMPPKVQALLEQQMKLNQEIAAAWAAEPNQPVKNYAFTTSDGKPITLAELFGPHNKLILVHNMGFDCPYCTLWADGFNGTSYFYDARGIAFAIASPDPLEKMAAGKAQRGWEFPMVHAPADGFHKDMGYVMGAGVFPGASTFVKLADGSIERYAHSPFGPGDSFCAVFQFFNMLPGMQGVH